MKMLFLGIIKSIWHEYIDYLKKYFIVSGRASRHQFWAVLVFNFILGLCLKFVPYGSETFSALTIIPSFTLYIRRFHDINYTKKQISLLLTPLILGLIFGLQNLYILIFLIFYILGLCTFAAIAKGDSQANKYGPAPKYNDSKHQNLYIATAVIYAVIEILSLYGTLNETRKTAQLLNKAENLSQGYAQILDEQLLTPIYQAYPEGEFPQNMQTQLLKESQISDGMKSFIKNGGIKIIGQGQTFAVIFNNLSAKLCLLTLTYQGSHPHELPIAHNENITPNILEGKDFANGCICQNNQCSVAFVFKR